MDRTAVGQVGYVCAAAGVAVDSFDIDMPDHALMSALSSDIKAVEIVAFQYFKYNRRWMRKGNR